MFSLFSAFLGEKLSVLCVEATADITHPCSMFSLFSAWK
jgi:hypothetical protein